MLGIHFTVELFKDGSSLIKLLVCFLYHDLVLFNFYAFDSFIFIFICVFQSSR